MKIETYVHGKTELPRVGDLVLKLARGDSHTYIQALVVNELTASNEVVEGPGIHWSSNGYILSVNTPWSTKIIDIDWIVRFAE